MIKEFIILLLFVVSALCFIPSGCENNNEEELYGLQICDTINITWESKISKILQTNCVECHNSAFNYRNIRHDTYAEELKVIQSGRLRGAVNHTVGFIPMPFNRNKLRACEVQQINLWLDNGYPEK